MTPSTAIFAGRYRVIAPIGGGTPSMTYVAVDEYSRIEVVLKRFAVRDALGWKQVELAEREAQVLRGLDHELLPRYLDHVEQDGALFTVMTRLPGEDLRAARERGLRFTAREAFMLLLDARSIFDYLHGHLPPIIHRDIKPSNVLICPDGRFRLVDFGSVARALRADGTTVVGTFGYMAPEQFQGRAGPGVVALPSPVWGLLVFSVAPALVGALRLWRRLFNRQLPAPAAPSGTRQALDDRAHRGLPPGPGV